MGAIGLKRVPALEDTTQYRRRHIDQRQAHKIQAGYWRDAQITVNCRLCGVTEEKNQGEPD